MQEAIKQEVVPDGTYRLENIFVKNLSLEIPSNVVTPSFDKEPTVQLELRNSSRPLSRDNYCEIMLEATARVRSGEDLQLLIEVSQAGIFFVGEEGNDKRQTFLNVKAPEILYPHLSYLIADLMSRAGAPRIFLPPFDFQAVYAQRKKMMEQQLAEKNADKTINA